MSQESKISISIDDARLKSVREKLRLIREELSDVLVINLTNEERKNMLKMGDKTLAFVGKAIEFAEQNPSLTPAYMDLFEAKKDYELARKLNELLKDVTTLQRGLEDTMMVAGSESYDAALIFYGSVKGASRTNVSGAQAVYDELRERFPGRPKKSSAEKS